MLKGIDVSSYQSSTPDLSGLSFVFIKVTEGLSYVNPKWRQQAATARAKGAVVGLYHYPHIGNGAVAEAGYFLAQAATGMQAGDILCLDWEWYNQPVSDQQARDYKSGFLDALKSARPTHRSVLYADRNSWLNVDTDSKCGDGLWIADYTTAGAPRISHPWLFHQYTDAPEDEDVASPQFATLADLKAWASAATQPPAPAPAPKPTPTPAPAPAPVPQWRRLLDHVMAVPEGIYEHWVSGTGWDNVTPWGAEYAEQGVPWCVIWDWCMYNETGLAGIVPKTDNVAGFTTWAQQHGQWSEYPSVGAWVNFGGGGHTELVIGFNATTVFTKGGNSVATGATDNGQGNGLFTHSRARTDAYVTGYFAPRFPDGHCPPTADPHDPRGGTAQTSYAWPGPATPIYLEDDMFAYLPPIPANTDVDVPVEPAGTATAPQGGAKNGPIWLALAAQGADGTAAVSLRQNGKWVAAQIHAVSRAGGKVVVSLPSDGSVDVVRVHSTVPLVGYVVGRQVS